jgi:hypothetical protein
MSLWMVWPISICLPLVILTTWLLLSYIGLIGVGLIPYWASVFSILFSGLFGGIYFSFFSFFTVVLHNSDRAIQQHDITFVLKILRKLGLCDASLYIN